MTKSRRITYLTLILGTFLFSQVAFALDTTDAAAGVTKLSSLIGTVNGTLLKALGTLFMSLAVVAFLFGIVEYIWGMRQGDPGKAKVGNQFIMWGLLGLFVMFSVYGIIKFGQQIFFQGQDVNSISIPTINLGGTGSQTNGGSAGNGSGNGSQTNGGLGGGGNGGNQTSCTPNQECTVTGGGNGICNTSGTSCDPVN